MISKKKISIGSEITQAERPKKFVRKNSHCSLNCRSGSASKLTPAKYQKEVSIRNEIQHSIKMQTQSQKFYKKQEEGLITSNKRCSESLKLDIHKAKQMIQQRESSRRFSKLEENPESIESLKTQCKRLKVHLDQQRQKRKLIEQQMKLSHIEIKRLQRRLQKYKHENQVLKKQSQEMLLHIELLQNKALSSQMKLTNSFKVKILEQQIGKLREELKKDRTVRQNELLKQIDEFAQQKYNLSKQINSNILANNALIKQIQEMDEQLEQLRVNSRQKVIRSIQYIELRERYKLLLAEHRQLKQEFQHIQKLNATENHSRIDYTLLTVSNESEVIQ